MSHAGAVGNLAVRLGQVLIPLVVLAAWQEGSSLLNPILLPSPLETARALWEGFSRGWLLDNLELTLRELALGYMLAVAGGVVIGVALGLSRLLGEAFEPVVLNVYAIPKVTLFPLFVFVFKLGMASKVAFGMWHGIFPVIILTMTAVRGVKPVYLKVGRSLRLRGWRLFSSIIFPAVLPPLMTGFRLGFNLCFLGVILGEMFASRKGLGYVLMASGGSFDMERILAVVTVVAVVALSVNTALYAMERKLGARSESRLLEA